MEDRIHETIKQIHDIKKAKNKHPDFATFAEVVKEETKFTVKHSEDYLAVFRRIKEALNALNRAGIIRVGETINDKYLELI